MGTSEISAPSVPPAALPQVYNPTAGELKLLQWTYGNKAYRDNPGVITVIEKFLYRKPNASLDALSISELNAFKIEAATLGVSLVR
jgi:hypothetical protein